MKKIGILTLPLNDNYGGMLQAVALYGFLTQKGYEVVFLTNEYFKNRWKSLIWSAIARIPFQNLKGMRYAHKKRAFHNAFLRANIPNRSRPLKTALDFKKLAEKEKFDAVIVGSDQVWRWDYILDGFERYFLNFVERSNTRKIAYAASFGKPEWQAPEKASAVSALLSDFHAISTRESDAVTICYELGVGECVHVLDPTMLVGKEFYNHLLIKTDRVATKKTLLTYVLDEKGEKLSFINKVNQCLGTEYFVKSLGLQSNLTAAEWVTAFHDADFVITDSFHGMVFSILFNKQFIVIGNSHRGVSRFTSLLQYLNISSRLVVEDNLQNLSAQTLVSDKVNYTEVDSKINLFRDISSKFLIDAIEK